jgi:hypothetical protein
MIINKKEKFIEVAAEEGKVLYIDGETFEGLTCPLNADLTIYQEVTIEEAEILTKEYKEANGIEIEEIQDLESE